MAEIKMVNWWVERNGGEGRDQDNVKVKVRTLFSFLPTVHRTSFARSFGNRHQYPAITQAFSHWPGQSCGESPLGVLSEMSVQDHRKHPFYLEAILLESSKTDNKILPVGLSQALWSTSTCPS